MVKNVRGFTLTEVLVVMIILSIALSIVVLLMTSVYRGSIVSFDRITVQDELAKIDAAIRRELLKAGPTIEGLTVQSTSVEFYAIVPFSKQLYGTYAPATRLRYKLIFANGRLELQINDDAGYMKRIVLGELDDCRFEGQGKLIRYSLTKKNVTLGTLDSSVVLYNLK
uniref:Prepilin-type N-terminal cleavage/methylation domain-containing protein n=1 Tax=Pseudothermotoga hypogea TaxID=57487 RepID=A0A832MNJ8_9THEM